MMPFVFKGLKKIALPPRRYAFLPEVQQSRVWFKVQDLRVFTTFNMYFSGCILTCVLTNTCSIGTFGHTIGAEVNAGVTTPCVFALLI